ncbi:MAG: glycosyltransferase family 4 protein [Pseudomonadota bacterium]
MPVQPLLATLLEDAVEQIALAPHASFRWHVLDKLIGSAQEAPVLEFVRALVLQRLPAGGEAGFLRANFLAHLINDAQYTAQAAFLIQAISPCEPERLMAFAAYEWGHAVTAEGDHQHFVDALRNAQVPELMRQLGDQLAASAGLPKRRVDTIRKIALLIPMFGNSLHPPTEMALQQAALLAGLGYQVTLYSAQDQVLPTMEHYLGFSGRLVTGLPDLATLPSRLQGGVSVTLADTRFSLTRRWRDVLAVIARDDPDLVMFVGLNAPLMQPLYRARPVLGMGVHAVPPMAPCDAWLAADPARGGCDSSDWGPAFPPAFGHYHPFRVLRKPGPGTLQRAQLDLPADALVLLTVGGRLVKEIKGDWARRMLAVLERHPQVVWLLAGGAGDLPAALEGARPGQVRTSPHRPDLGAVYALCDVAVNPPRVGGGLSAAEAMAAGLPVLALAGGDSGHKMGNLAMANESEFFATLDDLLASPARRAELGQAMRQRFDDTLDLARSGPSLRAACELALARFAKRQPSS